MKARKAKPSKPPKPPKPANTTTVSTISLLQQILEQAKLTNVLLSQIRDEAGVSSAAITLQLREISEQITRANAIALDSQKHLADIDTELAAQGEELEEQGNTLEAILEAIQGPFQPTTGSDLTQTS